MRWLVVVLLIACGGKKDEPKPTADVSALVKPTTTVLEEAKQLASFGIKRIPSVWVALARADKTALADAIAAAREAENGVALATAADVAFVLGDPEASKLLDEAIETKLGEHELGALLSPVAALESKQVIERLAAHTIEKQKYVIASGFVAFGSPAWEAFVSNARTFGGNRVHALQVLGWRARSFGQHSMAKELVAEAVAIAMKNPADYYLPGLAAEVAFVGDTVSANKLMAIIAKAGHSEEAAERAPKFAKLAEIAAVLGDKAASEGYEKKARLAVDKAGEDLALDEAQDVWRSIAVARGKRKDGGETLAIVREHLKNDAPGDVALALVEQGERELAAEVLALTGHPHRAEAIAHIVRLEVDRGELDPATKRSLAAADINGSPPGLEFVMRAHALTANVKAVVELRGREKNPAYGAKLDDMVAVAIQILGRNGKCEEAVAASKDIVVNRARHFAQLARYCPNTKL